MKLLLSVVALILAAPTFVTLSFVVAETATTTRYWDCSGGACGCAYLPPHLQGNHELPAHCYSNALFDAPVGNPFGATFYGSAAVSQALGGGDWMAEACGKCWKVTGTANIPSYDTTTVTTLVLKGTNYCPPDNQACANGKRHFDIAAPGFDFHEFSLSNTCSQVEPNEIAGFESCEYWMIDSDNPNENCNCNLFSNSVLRNGCQNFKSLHWDNPAVDIEEVNCPTELAQLPCWEENGNDYPWPDAPALCLDPLAESSLTPAPAPITSKPTAAPTFVATNDPTAAPITSEPTAAPTRVATNDPTAAPITSEPTAAPTLVASGDPTLPGVVIETATTTRHWDCSGGACGCAYLPPHLQGNHALPAHCYCNALFDAPVGNPFGATFYGSAAVSQSLGGGDWLAEACGKCWKVTGTANIPGYDTTTVTTLVLKGTNYCPPENEACANGKRHFVIAAPGFDLHESSLSNTCTQVEPDEIAGFESCEYWMVTSDNPNENCNCNLFSNSVLRNGCQNFKSLHWDNPTVDIEEVNCPTELAQLPCWEENGNDYPWPDAPALCLDPLAESSLTPAPGPIPSKPTVAPTLVVSDNPTVPSASSASSSSLRSKKKGFFSIFFFIFLRRAV